MPRRFQFSTRDLLGAVALASAGLVTLRFRSITPANGIYPAVLAVRFVACGAFFGGAIGMLLRRPIRSALIGSTLMALVFFGLAIFASLALSGFHSGPS